MTDVQITTADEQKRQRILEGATKVVLTYGYHRTTMDDIARSADMSRPALYLLFRNKTDIYRAIAKAFMDGAADHARATLTGEGSLDERLFSVVDGGIIAMMEKFSGSPHGAEILDMKNSLAKDLVSDWVTAMTAILTETLAHEAEANGVDLEKRGYSAKGLAELFWDGVEGMKMRNPDADDLRKAARMLAGLVANAVRR